MVKQNSTVELGVLSAILCLLANLVSSSATIGCEDISEFRNGNFGFRLFSIPSDVAPDKISEFGYLFDPYPGAELPTEITENFNHRDLTGAYCVSEKSGCIVTGYYFSDDTGYDHFVPAAGNCVF